MTTIADTLTSLRILNRRIDQRAQSVLVSEALKKQEGITSVGKVGTAIVVPDGPRWVYVAVDENLAELNGRTVADHIGHSVRDVLPPELAERACRLLERVWFGEDQVEARIDGAAGGTSRVSSWVATYQLLKYRDTPVAITAIVRERIPIDADGSK